MAVIDDTQKFMTIGAMEGLNKSFEEVRIDDYLKAYMTTGRPPQPCPQEPASDVARSALGLPPLFKPYSASPPGTSSLLSSTTATTTLAPVPTCRDPSQLPIGQEFKPAKVDSETFHSIVAAAEYAFFSPEELRYYAYLKGNKLPPLSVKMDPFVMSTVTPTSTSTASTLPPTDSREKMESIVCQPLFADHSFEELRVFFMLAGKELNSAEIRQFFNQPAPAPIVPSTPVSNPHIPAPIIAAPVTPGPPISATPGPAFSFKFGA
ncbi:hypothetical protein CC1G_05999 [Coprinopsis cinerea okayama7|uniref:Uncharacterized protein n=1 Tax=Coprinopsis cinerea (strain Okayama-7 / 130 / ATCC MYA-4618 / FGSC 9003) TaxID=240176 RepID=A8N4M1_COPC7|nr:hypothetical protein CC1G_05999 [Coprinopsis cinerea okayama7\|eukprot:XP_001829790.1 hypothetical protein CC1G_05999 [Coprinopsis cinerea okayama7\